MKRILPISLVILLGVLITPCLADSITYGRVDRPLIAEQLKLVQEGESDRVHSLHKLLQKAGCPQVMEQAVPKEDLPNVICLLPGEEEGTIIVGAALENPAD